MTLRDAALSGWFNPKTGELLSGFPLHADDILLDYGCGDMPLTAFAATRVGELILSDADAAKLETARERLAAKHPRALRTVPATRGALALADASVTRVVATEVLEHVDDPARVIADLARVARPGALLLLSVPDPESENLQKPVAPKGYFQYPNHVRIFERAAFQSLVTGAGLQIERSLGVGFYWTLWWTFFWTCNVDLKDAGAHPLLATWERTWALLLETNDGPKVKAALDARMPKTQILIARKP